MNSYDYMAFDFMFGYRLGNWGMIAGNIIKAIVSTNLVVTGITARSLKRGVWGFAWSLGAAETAGAFTVGKWYSILTVGTTNYTLIGAANNTINTVFQASGVGAGTGTATPLPINWIDGPGATSSQTIAIPLTDLGAISGNTINVQAGYSLTNPAGIKTFVGSITSLVMP